MEARERLQNLGHPVPNLACPIQACSPQTAARTNKQRDETTQAHTGCGSHRGVATAKFLALPHQCGMCYPNHHSRPQRTPPLRAHQGRVSPVKTMPLLVTPATPPNKTSLVPPGQQPKQFGSPGSTSHCGSPAEASCKRPYRCPSAPPAAVAAPARAAPAPPPPPPRATPLRQHRARRRGMLLFWCVGGGRLWLRQLLLGNMPDGSGLRTWGFFWGGVVSPTLVILAAVLLCGWACFACVAAHGSQHACMDG